MINIIRILLIGQGWAFSNDNMYKLWMNLLPCFDWYPKSFKVLKRIFVFSDPWLEVIPTHSGNEYFFQLSNRIVQCSHPQQLKVTRTHPFWQWILKGFSVLGVMGRDVLKWIKIPEILLEGISVEENSKWSQELPPTPTLHYVSGHWIKEFKSFEKSKHIFCSILIQIWKFHLWVVKNSTSIWKNTRNLLFLMGPGQ